MSDEVIERAAAAVRRAEALFVAAGAGMGVDSGLPDFRGNEGFWKAYPPFAELGLSFVELANPAWFEDDPSLAWGFYGHRRNLYRATAPHPGFALLAKWAARMPAGAFVFTSNVDGQFQRAGFDGERIAECHGSLLHLQCVVPCHGGIWEAGAEAIDVDPKTFRARGPLPRCPVCGRLARPNVLMFGDGQWLSSRSAAQERRLDEWMEQVGGRPLVVIELGAGSAVPTVRITCENLARQGQAPLIRINPREPEGPSGTLSIPQGALAALAAIDEELAAGAS
jgi:NAD-dependent SIR2 family protein deacetylase